MSVSVTLNGSSFTIPSVRGETGWQTQVTTWIQSVSLNTLQKNGGTFTLTADINFGTTYGVTAKFFSASSYVALAEIATPSSPASGTLDYAKSDNRRYFVGDPGVEHKYVTDQDTIAVAKGGTNVTSYTKGDILIASGATTLTKLPVSTDNFVLTLDSAQTTGVKWSTPAIGNLIKQTKTANYTLLASDDIAYCDSSGGVFTITLPSAASNDGKVFRVVKTEASTNAVIFNGIYLSTNGESLTVASNGTTWYNISHLAPNGYVSNDSAGSFSVVGGLTTNYADILAITIPAGEWEISGTLLYALNGATLTGTTVEIGISSTPGNSTAGLVDGTNSGPVPVPTSTQRSIGHVPRYRVILTAATVYNLKGRIDFSAGSPKWCGNITARKVLI